jgi:hypothetical protein
MLIDEINARAARAPPTAMVMPMEPIEIIDEVRLWAL